MLECDLVMKGGVTSGAVYPRAIARLAKDFRFRSIGGTSAGAIAAGAAAAAEYRRQSGGTAAGFDLVATLPEQLGEPGSKITGTRLLELFQPQAALKPLFGFLLAFLAADRTKEGKRREGVKIPRLLLIARVCMSAIGHFPGFALLGVVVCVAIAWALGFSFELSWRCIVLGGLAFAGALAFALLGVVCSALKLPQHFFGLCRGYRQPDGEQPEDRSYLTPWLNDLVQNVAGRPLDRPLTFGDLAGKGIELRMVTSNLCYGHPHRLPFPENDAWAFFDEKEWASMFPRSVVEHLKSNPPARYANPEDAHDRAYADAVKRIGREQGLLPLPDRNGLPVVVAIRLSLSFPVLLTATPLYLLDPEQRQHGVARKCWFSDGGISSNFPLHFFDAPIPSRPTFAIGLQDTDRLPAGNEQVSLPETNLGGLAHSWKAIQMDRGSATALGDFASAIFDVLQNWRDNSLLRLPGYRDRVAMVRLEPHEGGLNLTMPKKVLEDVAGYGLLAAEKLALHFAPQNAAQCEAAGIATTWENHRWLRLLSTLAALERLVDEFETVWSAPSAAGRGYADLLDPAITPATGLPGYKAFSPMQRGFALCCMAGIRRVIADCRNSIPGQNLQSHTPRPAMRYRLTAES